MCAIKENSYNFDLVEMVVKMCPVKMLFGRDDNIRVKKKCVVYILQVPVTDCVSMLLYFRASVELSIDGALSFLHITTKLSHWAGCAIHQN